MAKEIIDGLDWATMQDILHNTVVQVVAQISRFNWEEPYKLLRQYESRGSGFFIDAEGHIITTAHVIDEATTIWIHMPSLGKKAIMTDLISFCPERDIALLKVRKSDFDFIKTHIDAMYALPFGDSDLVRRTDNILVLGYPLGNYTMKSSTGVVSGRESYGGYSLIQITAPVNPGNSGGPLINAHGEIVGITIATIANAQNIGFAIPINELKIILDDLFTVNFVRRGLLGVLFNYASDEHARYLKNPVPTGIYITQVLKNSLFEQAGVQEGDILYEFNNYAIDEFGDATVPWIRDKVSLNDLVARLKNGDPMHLVIYRKGKRLELSTTFEVTKPNPIRKIYPHYEPVDYEIVAGIVVMELTDNHIPLLAKDMPFLINFAKPENKVEPVLVISYIMPGSYAQEQRNLSSGFIIAQVNDQPVSTLASFRKALLTSLETDLLAIKTADNILAVFPFRAALQEEEQLSKEFSYPLSKAMIELLAKI